MYHWRIVKNTVNKVTESEMQENSSSENLVDSCYESEEESGEGENAKG